MREDPWSPGFVSETLSLYVALSLLKHYFIDLFFFILHTGVFCLQVCMCTTRVPYPRGRSLDLHMKENVWCLSFWAWVTALSVIFPSAKKQQLRLSRWQGFTWLCVLGPRQGWCYPSLLPYNTSFLWRQGLILSPGWPEIHYAAWAGFECMSSCLSLSCAGITAT